MKFNAVIAAKRLVGQGAGLVANGSVRTAATNLQNFDPLQHLPKANQASHQSRAMTPRQLLTSKKQDWQTPKELFDKLNAVFDFMVDPCTTDANPLGTGYYYTPKDDGLKQDWIGNAFVNPPYDNQEAFISKALDECNLNNTTNVCLIPARTDTKLWQYLIFPNARAVCFVKGRLTFGNAKNTATFPSALVVFSADNPLDDSQVKTLQSIGHLFW